jgi:hypothetical protein
MGSITGSKEGGFGKGSIRYIHFAFGALQPVVKTAWSVINSFGHDPGHDEALFVVRAVVRKVCTWQCKFI